MQHFLMKKSTNLKSGGFVTRMIWNYARNIKFHPTPKNTKTETKKRAKKKTKKQQKNINSLGLV